MPHTLLSYLGVSDTPNGVRRNFVNPNLPGSTPHVSSSPSACIRLLVAGLGADISNSATGSFFANHASAL